MRTFTAKVGRPDELLAEAAVPLVWVLAWAAMTSRVRVNGQEGWLWKESGTSDAADRTSRFGVCARCRRSKPSQLRTHHSRLTRVRALFAAVESSQHERQNNEERNRCPVSSSLCLCQLSNLGD